MFTTALSGYSAGYITSTESPISKQEKGFATEYLMVYSAFFTNRHYQETLGDDSTNNDEQKNIQYSDLWYCNNLFVSRNKI